MKTIIIIGIVVFAILCALLKFGSEDGKVDKSSIVIVLIFSILLTLGMSACHHTAEKRGKIKELYSQAVNSYNSKSYEEAEEYLNEVLSIKPNHKKANKLLSKMKSEEKDREERIAKLLAEIKVLRDEGKYVNAYDDAVYLLEYLDPTNVEADKLRQELLEPANQQKAEQEAANAERRAIEAAEKAEQEAKEKAEAEKAESDRKAAEEAQKKAIEQEAKERAEQSRQNAANIKAKYIDSCIYVTSYDLLRSPSTYKNKPVNVSGTVSSQVNIKKGKLQSMLESAGITETSDYEMVEITDDYGEIAVIYSPSAIGKRLLEGDWVNIYGDSLGLTELTLTVFGTTSSYKIPEVRLNFID